MKQHQCPLVVGQERGNAVATVRAWRLNVAELRDDRDAMKTIALELEGCAFCMGLIVQFLLGMTKSSLIHAAQGTIAPAVAAAEKELAKAVDEVRQQMGETGPPPT
jgi:hypothetical protein